MSVGASALLAVAALLSPVGPLPGQEARPAQASPVQEREARPYERFAAFLSFFEPETAVLLGLSGETGRLSDLGEEGLAARTRGYRELREGLAGSRLFPQAPGGLAAAVDPGLFLDRRIAGFLRVRPWARSPLYYVRAAAEALATVDLDPALDPPERRRALTERARQLPYLLDAASAALVNPPRILTDQALAEGRLLERWIAETAVRAARLPEGGEKWALEQSLETASSTVVEFLGSLDADFGPRANGAPGLGEAVVSELARTYGFDGAYHVVETLGRAAEAMEAARRVAASAERLDPSPPESAASLASGFAAQWFGAGPAPAVATRFGPRVAGRPPVSVAWRRGASPSSRGLAWIHVAEDQADAPGLLEAVLADAASQAWLREAVGADGPASRRDTGADSPAARPAGDNSPAARSATRLLVAWDGLAPAARWFALATQASPAEAGSRDGRTTVSLSQAADLARTEAEAARLAALVHLGLLDAHDATRQIAASMGAAPPGDDVTSQPGNSEARRLLAGHLSDPTEIFAPALGFLLFERWLQQNLPPPASLFEEWLGAAGEAAGEKAPLRDRS